jgi:Rod binding domain-containing protein
MDKIPILHNRRLGEVSPFESKSGAGGNDREKLKKACTEFEGLFIQEILKFMRQTIPASPLGEAGAGKEVYQSLLDQELSKNLAKKGGLRIGEMVYRQMLRQEEKKTSAPGPLNPLALQAPELKEK